MSPRAIALAALLVACRATAPAAPAAPAAPTAEFAPPTPRSTVAVRDDVAPVWVSLAAGSIAGPLGDVGALDGAEAVVIAGGALYRWRGPDAAEPVCVEAIAAAPRGASLLSLQADGDRFVALGGAEDEPVVLRSDDRGARCERVRVPSLFLLNAPRSSIAHSLHGERAFVWGSTGAIVRSDDGARTWRRLPSLAGVIDLAPGPASSTVAAVFVGRRVEHARARLYALDTPGAAWRPIDGAELLNAPVSLQSLADGTTAVGHGSGALTLDASLAVRTRRVDPASRYVSHRPRILVGAGDGRFFASTASALLSVDAAATEAVAAIAGAQPTHAIDASRDGWLWVTDGRGLWRGRFDAPFAEVSSHPLGAQVPVAFAARGTQLLLVGNGRAAAYRDDTRPGWQRLTVPASIGRVLAAHIDDRGTLFVLGSSGLAVSDAGEFVAVPAPSLPLSTGAPTQFAVMGDRWVVSGGALYTSDDHGAQWESRFGSAFAVTPGVHPAVALAALQRPTIVASVMHGASVLALDHARTLWRSDDAGATFNIVATVPSADESPFHRSFAPSVLAWDGARRVAVLHRSELQLSTDGGRAFSASPAPFVARWAAFSDNTLVASGAVTSLLPAQCRHDVEQALFVLAPDGWRTAADACAHRGTLLAHDGDALWLADASMNLQRASLSRLVRSVIRLIRATRGP